jgi:hypothetical protein
LSMVFCVSVIPFLVLSVFNIICLSILLLVDTRIVSNLNRVVISTHVHNCSLGQMTRSGFAGSYFRSVEQNRGPEVDPHICDQ